VAKLQGNRPRFPIRELAARESIGAERLSGSRNRDSLVDTVSAMSPAVMSGGLASPAPEETPTAFLTAMDPSHHVEQNSGTSLAPANGAVDSTVNWMEERSILLSKLERLERLASTERVEPPANFPPQPERPAPVPQQEIFRAESHGVHERPPIPVTVNSLQQAQDTHSVAQPSSPIRAAPVRNGSIVYKNNNPYRNGTYLLHKQGAGSQFVVQLEASSVYV
jgi:hypothetical protein